MKRFHTLLALLLVSTSFVACVSSDDNEESLSSDCYISSFTLGTMRRIVHTTGASGQDSTYYVTFSGTYYPLTIDQRKGTITNTEPMPYGTVLGNALANIAAQGSLIYAPEANLTDTTAWRAYASSDSIDFSEPLLFRAYAHDGSGYRQYRVTINVREHEKGYYSWQQVAQMDALRGRASTRLIAVDGQRHIFSTDTEGHLFKTDPVTGDDQQCSLPDDVAGDIATVCRFDNRFWMSSDNGLLLCSDNGVQWENVQQDDTYTTNGIKLITASGTALYAIPDKPLTDLAETWPSALSSTDGKTWTPIALEEEESFTSPTAATAYAQNNGNRRVIMVASSLDTNYLRTWSLLEDSEEPWTLFTERANPYPLPRMQKISILSCDALLMAVGKKIATDDNADTSYAIYMSHDNGITWKTADIITLPSALQTSSNLSAAADEGLIWLLADTQLWQAQINP